MKAELRFVSIKIDKIRRITVAYNNIRLRPTSIPAERLAKKYMEEFLAEPANTSSTSAPGDAVIIHNEPPDPIFSNYTPFTMIFSIDQLVTHSTPPTIRDNALAEKDIGPLESRIQPQIISASKTLASQKQALLSQILASVSFQQFTAAQRKFAPPWILEEALESELETNLKDVYDELLMSDNRLNANVVNAHAVHKVKSDGVDKLHLKCSLVLHGNQDKDRFSVRKNSASADTLKFRLILFLSSILKLKLAIADVKDAYMQPGPIKRDVFARPSNLLCQHTKFKY